MPTMNIFLTIWLLGIIIGGLAYWGWSRGYPEYKSAREFEDTVAGIVIIGWPILLPVAIAYLWYTRD